MGLVVTKTLLLNASDEPLALLPWRRALRLVHDGKVEVLAHADEALHTPTTTLARPSVVRLVARVTVPMRRHLRVSLANLLVRDHGRCGYCGDRATTIDHVVPRSRGGAHVWENVVAACRPCNLAKGDRLLAELGWTLARTPAPPQGLRWLRVAAEVMQPEWLRYLDLVEGDGRITRHRSLVRVRV